MAEFSKATWYADLRRVAKDHPEAAASGNNDVERKRNATAKWMGEKPAKKAHVVHERAPLKRIERPTATHKMGAITNIVNLYHRGMVRADVAVSVINEISRGG